MNSVLLDGTCTHDAVLTGQLNETPTTRSPPDLVIPPPHFSRLKLGDDLLIRGGPYSGRHGILRQLSGRYAAMEIGDPFKRVRLGAQPATVTIAVPVEYVSDVPAYTYDDPKEQARLAKDPYGYIQRSLQPFFADGGDRFRCRDPSRFDVQVRWNWVWFSGQCDYERATEEGFPTPFVVNMFVAKCPVLLLTRSVLWRLHHAPNSMSIPEFKSFLAKKSPKRRPKIRNPRTCYRGRVYNPDDLLTASKNPRDSTAWYRFRRGHLMPASIQLAQVPELGVAVSTRHSKKSNQFRIVMQSMCYAMMLVPVRIARLMHISRWGVLSSKYGYQIAPKAPIPMTPEVAEQVELVESIENDTSRLDVI